MASLSSENETPTVESEGDSQGGTETLRPRPVRPPPPYRPSNNTSNSPEEPSFLSSELQDALNSPTLPTEQPPPYTPPTSVYTPPTTMLVPHEVQPLLESQVRWFYRDPNVYWKPFSGHDSLKLERQYQKLTAASGNTDPNEWTVRVHGEMSDANLQDMICESVFWKSPAQRILRGTWFEVTSEKKWYPLEKEDAEAVEGAHCDKSWRIRADTALKALSEAGQMSQAGKVEWNKIFLKNHNVVWYGDEEISMIKTDFSSRMMQKIGFAGGNKLVRGYKDSAMFEDGRQPPVKHFVFCTHGIGQLYDASEDVKSVVKSTTDLKNTCTELANKHFKHQWEGGRVEFLPVEWRSMLTLDRGIVETITPQGVRQLRDMANSTILDVIYYLSPVFHAEIIESVRFQLNKHFLHILERFPNFTVDGGKFSLFAHSLGSVIVYDILAECKPDPAAEDVGVDTDEKECLEIQLAKARAKVSELEDKMSALGKIPRSHRKKMGLKFPVSMTSKL
jgi:phospholipase DDHD1